MTGWDYWQRQEDEPLFPDIEWSKPETKRRKGRLAIVGGHIQGFELPALAYTKAMEAGAGEIQIVLPDALQKFFQDPKMPVVFAASTPIGSFAKGDSAMAGYLAWADHILLAGDFGRNSETSLFIEELLKIRKPMTLTKESFYYANHHAKALMEREDSTLVVSFSQLQELLTKAEYDHALNSKMGIVPMVEFLHDLTEKFPVSIVTYWQQQMIVANMGFISTTKVDQDEKTWQLNQAARSAVYAMHHSDKIFEALTTAAYTSVISDE